MFRIGDIEEAREGARARPCWRKQRHDRKEAAEAQARSLRKRELDGNGIHCYRCPLCHGWHVGHRRKGRKS